jgi:hypothetical protein
MSLSTARSSMRQGISTDWSKIGYSSYLISDTTFNTLGIGCMGL